MTSNLYAASGVDITAGSKTIDLIKDKVSSTHNPEVLVGLGSFGALFDLKQIIQDYKEPVLVQSMDGVGTKLIIAEMLNKFDTVGIDIVNHSCNDIVVMGAKPLTFLDYVAHEKLNPQVMATIVAGMADACKLHELALVGGETAEMPGVYLPGRHDIAGCITGVVEKQEIISGKNIQVGDLILGINSNGLHTNGYSLARKILFEMAGYKAESMLPELNINERLNLGEHLLKLHINYSKPILQMLNQGITIKGLAHITGGGFTENIPRVLPHGLGFEIQRDSWPVLPIFQLIQKLGSVSDDEMFRVFNMGIGMVLIISPNELNKIEGFFERFNAEFIKVSQEEHHIIGTQEFKLYPIGKIIKNLPAQKI
jgi:phosphoribosylformylglycinamidine cyclo-ligase